MNPESSGQWIITQVVAEADASGHPLSEAEITLLRTPVWDLPTNRETAIKLNNRVVALVRSAIDRAKAEGRPTVKVRRGLTIPVEWEQHYQAIYSAELPWCISGIVQNAFLGNPMTGERKPWKSP